MRKINTGIKIILAFLMIAAIFGVVGSIGVVNINNINKNGNMLYNNNTMGIVYCADAALAYEQLRFNILKLKDVAADLRMDTLDAIEANMDTIDLSLSEYEHTIVTDDNREIFDSLTKDWNAYKNSVQSSIDSGRSTPEIDMTKYMSDLILVGKKEMGDNIYQQFESMFSLNKTIASNVDAENMKFGESATGSMIALACAGVAIAIVIGMLIGSSIAKTVKKASKQLEKIAAGEDIDELNIEKFSGEFITIAKNLNAVRSSLRLMLSDATILVNAGIEGKLSTRANASQHMGSFRAIIEGFNKSLDAFTAPIKETVSVLSSLQKGDLSAVISGDYPGDHASIKCALNDTVATIRGYIEEISYTLKLVAEGDLTVAISSEYRGDFVLLKDSINSIVKALNALMSDIDAAANEVASGMQQVSGSSQTISQGASEQASVLDQLTASISQIAEQTKQNAQVAQKTCQLSVDVKDSAEDGNIKMSQMQEAMQDIGASSNHISKIIKVIDEIAFQTNLLALNAAVEAARAGVHGKGFAVVAEEVRNLAGRSAKAAVETTALIENSVNKVNTGKDIADNTADALRKIVKGAEDAVLLVGGITEASNQQATAILQINTGIDNLSGVVQSNSSIAQQTAATSQELSAQAQILQQMVQRFKLNSETEREADVVDLFETEDAQAPDEAADIKLD